MHSLPDLAKPLAARRPALCIIRTIGDRGLTNPKGSAVGELAATRGWKRGYRWVALSLDHYSP
jgi:hypothetical protein